MSATIHVNEDIKDRLRLLSRTGETDDEVLQRLIRYVEETDLEEIIEARWERLHKLFYSSMPLKKAAPHFLTRSLLTSSI
jgi:hypothetical protein